MKFGWILELCLITFTAAASLKKYRFWLPTYKSSMRDGVGLGLGGFGEGIAIPQTEDIPMFTPPPFSLTLPPEVAPKISIRGSMETFWDLN